MKKIQHIAFMLFGALVALTAFSSCSESSDDSENDFDDWQNKNEVYFNNVYTRAKSAVDKGDSKWKILTNWSINDEAAVPTNRVVVEVLEKGTGTESPIYTDSVTVFYRGRLIPTVNYTDGLVFDQSYTNSELNPETSAATSFVVSGLVDGFATALQYMHAGDYWRVYIPYQLGYGTVKSGSIPAFSTLVFDIYLHSFTHVNEGAPAAWHARQHIDSAEE